MAANSRARAATRFSPMSPARARACPTLAVAASAWAAMAWSPAIDWRAISSERRLPLAWASSSWQRRIPSTAGTGPQKAPWASSPQAQDSDGSSRARRAWVMAWPAAASASAIRQRRKPRAASSPQALARPRWSSNSAKVAMARRVWAWTASASRSLATPTSIRSRATRAWAARRSSPRPAAAAATWPRIASARANSPVATSTSASSTSSSRPPGSPAGSRPTARSSSLDAAGRSPGPAPGGRPRPGGGPPPRPGAGCAGRRCPARPGSARPAPGGSRRSPRSRAAAARRSARPRRRTARAARPGPAWGSSRRWRPAAAGGGTGTPGRRPGGNAPGGAAPGGPGPGAAPGRPGFRRRRQLDHGALLEHLAGDRGPFQHRPLGLVEPVEAGGEQGLDAGRDPQVVEVGGGPVAVQAAQPALLDQGGEQLLEEQRVALGRAGDPPGGRLGQGHGPGQDGQQLGRLGLAEGFQQQGGGVELAPGPAGPLLQELRPGHGHQQDGGAAAVVGHVVDQVEQARLGPVEVVEHHHQRPPAGQQLQQPPDRPGRLLGRAGGGLEPDELGDPAGDVVAVVPGVQQPAQLGAGLGRGVGVGDGGGLADHLGHRPVGDALAVGQAAAAQHGRPRQGGHGLA